MSAIADEVKVGDAIWGRTVSSIRQDKGDTQIMFTFEDGGILHVSQNRLIEDYVSGKVATLEDAIGHLRLFAANRETEFPDTSVAIGKVLAALEQSRRSAFNAQWQAEYDRTMRTDEGREGWF